LVETLDEKMKIILTSFSLPRNCIKPNDYNSVMTPMIMLTQNRNPSKFISKTDL